MAKREQMCWNSWAGIDTEHGNSSSGMPSSSASNSISFMLNFEYLKVGKASTRINEGNHTGQENVN